MNILYIPSLGINAKVLNKVIDYNDGAISPNKFGNKCKIYKINNVYEYQLEQYIKTLLKDNQNVLFYNIQFSKKNNILYFYVDSNLKLDSVQNNINLFDKSSVIDVLNVIKKTLGLSSELSNDVISLSDVLNFHRQLNNNCDTYKKRIERNINYILESENNAENYVVEHSYNDGKLNISFYNGVNTPYIKVSFEKKNGKMHLIYQDEGISLSDELLRFLEYDIRSLYDFYIYQEEIKKELNKTIRSINTPFVIEILNYGIKLYLDNNDLMKPLDIFLSFYNNNQTINVNSLNALTLIEDSLDNLLKNIYVRIADLPQFEHEDLTKLRSLLIEDEENEYENELKIYKVRSKMLKIKNYFKR